MLNQLIVNGIIAGSIYILLAVGFAVIYRTIRFFHFAHDVVFTAVEMGSSLPLTLNNLEQGSTVDLTPFHLKDVILVTIYSKLDQGDISAKEIRRIIKQFQEL